MIPDADQHVYFYSLNLTSGVTFRTATRNFYEKSVLVKAPENPGFILPVRRFHHRVCKFKY
jgi:hypothetical protein